MRTFIFRILGLTTTLTAMPHLIAQAQTKVEMATIKPEAAKIEEFKPEEQASKGSALHDNVAGFIAKTQNSKSD
jgi:hypothetical protein